MEDFLEKSSEEFEEVSIEDVLCNFRRYNIEEALNEIIRRISGGNFGYTSQTGIVRGISEKNKSKRI